MNIIEENIITKKDSESEKMFNHYSDSESLLFDTTIY